MHHYLDVLSKVSDDNITEDEETETQAISIDDEKSNQYRAIDFQLNDL